MFKRARAALWLCKHFDEAIEAGERALAEWDLVGNRGHARVILCLPSDVPVIDRDEGEGDEVYDLLTDRLGAVGECDVWTSSADGDRYYVYGSSMDDLLEIIVPMCVDDLNRRDAYLLVTSADRSVKNERRHVS